MEYVNHFNKKIQVLDEAEVIVIGGGTAGHLPHKRNSGGRCHSPGADFYRLGQLQQYGRPVCDDDPSAFLFGG